MTSGRDRRIDVLRGICIALVLILHFHLAYDLIRSPLAAVFPGSILRPLVSSGNYGVTIFFVISGYLITSTSIDRFEDLRLIKALPFYTFRFARIMPPLVLLLFVVTLLGAAGVPYFANGKHVSLALADLSVLTFWHNVLMAKLGYFNYCLNILWSLSVEELFYAAFPLLWIGLRRTWLVVGVWMVAIVAGPIYRSHHRVNDIEYLYAYLACFDAIAIGCCTALVARKVVIGRVARNALQACGASVMTVVYFGWSISDNAVFGPTFIALGAALFLLPESTRATDPESSSRLRPLAWLGRHSYELYLFHIVVLALMRNVFAKGVLGPYAKLLWFSLFLLVATTASYAISRYYAEPLNRRIRAGTKLLIFNRSNSNIHEHL